MQQSLENLEANELLGDILNDVDQILSGWEGAGSRDAKALWLKELLGKNVLLTDKV